MTRVLPPFPAAPLGSLSGFDLQKCVDYWPKLARFVSERPEQCLAAVRASFDDSDRCVAYVARTIAHKNQATPGYFWSSEQVGRAEVASFSRFLISIEDAIAHLDDPQPLPPNLPLDMAILGQACGHLLQVVGTLRDLALVFQVGDLFEREGLLTFNALAYRLDAALEATHNALQEAKLVAPHAAHVVGSIWRQNVFAAILDAGILIGEQSIHAADPFAHRAFVEGGPIGFDTPDREAVFRKLVAIVLANTAFSRTQVASYMVAAVNAEVAERRRLGQLDNLTPPVNGEGTPPLLSDANSAPNDPVVAAPPGVTDQLSLRMAYARTYKGVEPEKLALALEFIKANPGVVGTKLADRLDVKPSTFRKWYAPALANDPSIVRGANGIGYYFRGEIGET